MHITHIHVHTRKQTDKQLINDLKNENVKKKKGAQCDGVYL